MLICHRCGLTNLPYNVACPVCERPLQDEAAAAAKRAEWDALPKELREDQERVFERMRGGHQHHHQWLKKNRWTQSVLGAILVNMILGGSTVRVRGDVSSTEDLVPLYRFVGLKEVGVTYNHPLLNNLKHVVLVANNWMRIRTIIKFHVQ
jgi:hypothetical protein